MTTTHLVVAFLVLRDHVQRAARRVRSRAWALLIPMLIACGGIVTEPTEHPACVTADSSVDCTTNDCHVLEVVDGVEVGSTIRGRCPTGDRCIVWPASVAVYGRCNEKPDADTPDVVTMPDASDASIATCPTVCAKAATAWCLSPTRAYRCLSTAPGSPMVAVDCRSPNAGWPCAPDGTCSGTLCTKGE